MLREVERDILEVEDELKKLKERPRTTPAQSPAVITVKLWKEEADDKEGS
jgi:hypothetical protein